MDRFQVYIDYINNTGRVPLDVATFDEDHEPVGPRVREDMRRAGLIYYGGGGIGSVGVAVGIFLRPDLQIARPSPDSKAAIVATDFAWPSAREIAARPENQGYLPSGYLV